MPENARNQFRKEIRHFSRLVSQNYLLASFALAVGLIYIITSIFDTAPKILFIHPYPSLSPGLQMMIGALSLVGIGLGISWMLASFRMMREISEIIIKLDEKDLTITDNELTCLIVRTLAYYRDKRDIIRMMFYVCITGGCIFLLLAIPSSLDFFLIIQNGTELTKRAVLLFLPVILINYFIALKSLVTSYYFIRFSKTWDRRLHEIEESECALKRTLGLDEA